MLSVGLESSFKRNDPFAHVVFRFKEGTPTENLKKGDSVVIELIPLDSLKGLGYELSTTEISITLNDVP